MDAHPPNSRSIAEVQQDLGPEFRVRGILGEGRTAAVYRASESGLERHVAIKVPHAGAVFTEDADRRFEREARALAQLEHPNVARAYRFFRLTDDTPCLVMSLIQGRTLEDRLVAEDRLHPELALPILRDIGSALAAAHALDIVHRDVRPGNILWDEKKEMALLIDFGVATLVSSDEDETTRISSTGVRTDVTRYLAPEIFRDEEETQAIDMYALGVTAYEMLTGVGPYGRLPFRELLEATLHGTPRDLVDRVPDLDANIARAVRACLNRNPRQRPAAAEFVRAMEGRWQVRSSRGFTEIVREWIESPPRLLGYGFMGGGFVVGGTATLDQQYPGLLPRWAFTTSLAAGTAIALAAAVLEWSRTAAPESKRRAPYFLGGVGTVWAIATMLIVALMS